MKTFFIALGCVVMMGASVVAQEPAATPSQEPAVEVTAESIVDGESSVAATASCGTKARRHVVRTRAAVIKSRVGTRRGRCCR